MTASSPAGDSRPTDAAQQTYVLGVDGGGTKTAALVASIDENGRTTTIGRAISKSSNQVALGFDAAMANLTEVIEQACASCAISPDQFAAGTFALAGSGTESAKRKILDFINARWQLPVCEIVHDGQAVVAAGTPEGWGIGLIVGTGAVAYGINQAGEIGVVGGWGYWFGDEGSAYWLGQSALRAVAQAEDGRGRQTTLSAKVLDRLNVGNEREVLAELSTRGDVRQAIAGIANLVCDAAHEQDKVAEGILDNAADHWSQHIECLASRLGFGDSPPIALAGGVLGGSEIARTKLNHVLAARQIRPSSCQFVDDPVVGCLKLASQLLGNSKP